MKTKAIKAKISIKEPGADVPAGSFRATFATFNVVDHDHDVTVPGAFPIGAKVKIARWGHNWGEPNIGVGVIGADANSAWVDAHLFVEDSQAAKETYAALKGNGELQEWSYGFEIEASRLGQFEGEDVQFLEKVTPFEISPVMRGAGIGTQTDWVKDLESGSRLSDQFSAALTAVETVQKRVKALAALRAKEGRTLSAANHRRLSALTETVTAALADLQALLAATDPAGDGEDGKDPPKGRAIVRNIDGFRAELRAAELRSTALAR